MFNDSAWPIDLATALKRLAPIVLLLILWSWESWLPFFGQRRGRLVHAGRNLAIAVVNTVILCVAFGALTVAAAEWTAANETGVLHLAGLTWGARLALGLVLLDGWLYVWHRLNHAVPFLWRFHRMHHSDPAMDVTTATRFHLGEHVGSATLRLGLIPLAGLDLGTIVIYDLVLVAVTQFHHADISLGRGDRWLRWLIVTPDVHKLHHSDRQPETDSNFASVLSVWDRLAGTFRMRSDLKEVTFGLKELTEPSWQTVWGMLLTPFTRVGRERTPRAATAPPHAPAALWQAAETSRR
jgi:sterol desaturase/sphingolipid hydroxylase (fatty acid hydroxylase superfamily)